MSWREQLYRNALDEIHDIYVKSKYKEEVDLYRSFDILNSINENQFASKSWLVDKLVPHLDHEKLRDIIILGSWYGLTSMLLREHVKPHVKIVNIDSDPSTRQIGERLSKNIEEFENTVYRVDDAANYFLDDPERFEVIINTSCEHMEDEDTELITRAKNKNALVCFQSNNYHSVQSHINTKNSLDEFVDSLDLFEVLHKEEMKAPSGNYDRYMVIGI